MSPSGLDEAVLEECLQYLERQLESSQVRKAMEEFFSFRWVSCPCLLTGDSRDPSSLW